MNAGGPGDNRERIERAYWSLRAEQLGRSFEAIKALYQAIEAELPRKLMELDDGT